MKALSIERGKKRSKEDVIFGVVNYTLFAVFTLICVYPFYYLIINSLSANDLSGNGSINFLPRQLHLENYKQVLQLKGLATAALVSVARTAIGTVCTVLASAFLGFMFTQEGMWKRKIWYRMLVVTMYFNAGPDSYVFDNAESASDQFLLGIYHSCHCTGRLILFW